DRRRAAGPASGVATGFAAGPRRAQPGDRRDCPAVPADQGHQLDRKLPLPAPAATDELVTSHLGVFSVARSKVRFAPGLKLCGIFTVSGRNASISLPCAFPLASCPWIVTDPTVIAMPPTFCTVTSTWWSSRTAHANAASPGFGSGSTRLPTPP